MANLNTQEDIIYQTKSFVVERAPQPFVSREEGGHLKIFPKNKKIRCINDLTPKEAIELIRLEMVVRDALIEAMNARGVPVVWVNLEDLGNWAFKRNEDPVLHIQIFGRAKTATKQKWPEAVYLPARSSGFYDGFEALTPADMLEIKKAISQRFEQEEYSDKTWGLIN